MDKNDLLVVKMKEKGMDVTELAYVLGIRESTAYSYCRPNAEKRRPIKKSLLHALDNIFKCDDFVK